MKTLIVTIVFILSSAYSQAADSKGNCSPNANIIINNTFFCINGLKPDERNALLAIKQNLERHSTKSAELEGIIIKKLNSIASKSDNKFAELRVFNDFLVNNIDSINENLIAIKLASENSYKASNKILEYMLSQPAIFNTEQLPVDLDGKPKLAFIPVPLNKKPISQIVSESKCTSLAIIDSISKKYPELSRLVIATESMDCNEKQYWFDLLPSMTDEQINKLFTILDTERSKLEELEIKYQNEIICLNNKHLLEWQQFQNKTTSTSQDNEKSRFEIMNAALNVIDSGCDSSDANEVVLQIKSLPEAAGYSDNRMARIFAKLYKTKQFSDPYRATLWTKIAFDKGKDDWDNVISYIGLLVDKKDYLTAYNEIKQVVFRGKLAELQGNSEDAIQKKLHLYWLYLFLSKKTENYSESERIAKTGYNLSKMLLEKYPSERRLEKIIFFFGHLVSTSNSYDSIASDYLMSLADIAKKLNNSGVISSSEYASSCLNISWYCLLAKKYEKAIEISNNGLLVDKNYIKLYTNLAHGLTLSGKLSAGKDIYIKFKGVKIDDQDWENIIIEDFDILKKHGIESQEFNSIRSLLHLRNQTQKKS